MRQMLRLLTLTALSCCWTTAIFAQTPGSGSAEVMRQLLALPAPTPRQTQTLADAGPENEEAQKFFDQNNPPPDDAPIEDVLMYWVWWATASNGPVPSDIIQQRLLQVCVDDIKKLPNIVSVFPYRESTAKRIKELFDKASGDKLLDDSGLKKIKEWQKRRANRDLQQQCE